MISQSMTEFYEIVKKYLDQTLTMIIAEKQRSPKKMVENMEINDGVEVKINQLKGTNNSQSVTFNIFQMTATFEKAIDILNQTNSYILGNSLNSDKQYKIRYSNILYIDYVDRNVCLYTEKETYWVRSSFISIVRELPKNFIQVSKNTAVNIFQIIQIEPAMNGNLILTLITEEKMVVTRRYIKKLKIKLEQMI
ncbi:hypothetical protein P788_2850 [Enterococcus faecalis MTUP9]|nr:hypothetical protein P788_2850 [Enterococcus faecalis MTUP9]